MGAVTGVTRGDFSVESTQHGGYLVLPGRTAFQDTGYLIRPLYAGGLEECLNFIKQSIVKFDD